MSDSLGYTPTPEYLTAEAHWGYRSDSEWAVREIWDGMEGDIYVVVSTRSHGDHDSPVLVGTDGVREDGLADAMHVRRYMAQGDAIALTYVAQTLSTLYGPDRVRYVDAACYIPPESRQLNEIKSANIVLLCRARANVTVWGALEAAELSWLFPDEDQLDVRQVRTHPSGAWLPAPDQQDLDQDYGVFFRVTNPSCKQGTRFNQLYSRSETDDTRR